MLQRNGGEAMVGNATGGAFKVTRVQGNIVARRERQLLTWLCSRLPSAVTPDGLTILSVAGAAVAFASYVASRWHPGWLWLASLGIVANWFGDSLDGSLARHRRIERPVYGYFLDHTVDALNNLLMMAGLGFTTGVSMAASLFALLGYFLLCIYVFINNHLSGVFQLSFLWGGPTELRMAIVLINTAMVFAPRAGVIVAGTPVTIYDALLVFAGCVFTLIYATRIVAGIRLLRDPARSGAALPDPGLQSAATKPSSASK